MGQAEPRHAREGATGLRRARAHAGRVRPRDAGPCGAAQGTPGRALHLGTAPRPTGPGGWLEWGPWAIGDGLNARSTTFEVERARPHTALLPLAAVEAHGPHLPVGCDTLVVESIARRAAALLGPGAYLLPTIPFGSSTHLRGTPGTADLSPDTLRLVLQDVAVALHETGIHRIAVIAGPGLVSGNTVIPFGNFIAKAAVRQLNHEYPGMDAIWVQPLAAAGRALGKIFESAGADVHAGEVETSLAMASVRRSRRRRARRPRPGGRTRRPRSGAPGHAGARPGLGPAEPRHACKGEAALAAAAEATAGYIGETLETLGRMKKSGR